MSTLQLQNYVAGEWIAGVTTSNDVNPSDGGDVVAEYAQADKAPTERAVKAARAAKAIARMAKFQLEMGGKNPSVVLDNADLKTAVECAVDGAFLSTGQRCTASSRLIVTKGIHDKSVAAVVERLKGVKVDNALKQGTDIGLVVDKNQLNQDLFYMEEAKKEGGKLAFGGRKGSSYDPREQGRYAAAFFITVKTS
jgi:acyl-CoA reductase-like NAD-dependent aldehyde dehydrogenase